MLSLYSNYCHQFMSIITNALTYTRKTRCFVNPEKSVPNMINYLNLSYTRLKLKLLPKPGFDQMLNIMPLALRGFDGNLPSCALQCTCGLLTLYCTEGPYLQPHVVLSRETHVCMVVRDVAPCEEAVNCSLERVDAGANGTFAGQLESCL